MKGSGGWACYGSATTETGTEILHKPSITIRWSATSGNAPNRVLERVKGKSWERGAHGGGDPRSDESRTVKKRS